MGFVRTVVRRQVAATIEHNVTERNRLTTCDNAAHVSDHAGDPEKAVLAKERGRLAMETLNQLHKRDREISKVLSARAEPDRDLQIDETDSHAVPAL